MIVINYHVFNVNVRTNLLCLNNIATIRFLKQGAFKRNIIHILRRQSGNGIVLFIITKVETITKKDKNIRRKSPSYFRTVYI